MNTTDQYKDEAMRLLDTNPLDVCTRIAQRLNGRGWHLDNFACKVEIFDAIRWYVKVHIKTDVTKKTVTEKWNELVETFARMELTITMISGTVSEEARAEVHRKYDSRDSLGRRTFLGNWYDFYVQFQPAKPLDVSVLTEEET
jgi:hypothetical protein